MPDNVFADLTKTPVVC